MSATTKQRARSNVPGRRRDPAVDDAILKAAVELFIEHGIEGANFEQISKRTGISRATIYRRWRSKEELLVSALRRTKRPEGLSPEALERMSPSELVAVVREAITNSLTQPGARELFARLIGSMPTHPELMTIYREEFVDPMWRAISACVKKARTSGAFPRAPDERLLRDLLSGATLHRALLRMDTAHPKKERAWVEKLLCQAGLTTGST
ncbi:MAG TPA: TetR/AcrR family transcriptional regulator [Bryobacteraceae bacterium]|jgi:AcrR family transcriptional regulator|nr:TetR/AcrR family transcriptional regulator [Bryobacteraceae bacterium]